MPAFDNTSDMRLKAANDISRPLRYAIGAGTLVLALVSFSGLCCEILGYCTGWIPFVERFGFWEVTGVLFGLMLASLGLHSLLRRNGPNGMPPHVGSTRVLPNGVGFEPTDRPSWRSALNQMTQDERERLRQLIEHGFRIKEGRR